jgi:serine kinase of HPr protein (carbohydrate metabolism regulator)
MLERLHGTAIAVAGRAVLIRGPSGAGKSDLALRIVASGARWPRESGEPLLVADDQVEVALENGALMVSAPATIAGRLEVRGVGIVTVPHVPKARLALVVDLVEREKVSRLPEPESTIVLGVALPRFALDAFSASAPLKVLVALASVA